jgi:dihydrolipoamide dehydrogenase
VAEVQLPQLGESVTEGIITAWLVKPGDTVTVDQPIVEISTDKVDTEIPSPIAGTITELRADVDDTVQVGQVIAVITADNDATPAPKDAPADDAPAKKEAPKDAPAAAAPTKTEATKTEATKTAPAPAKKAAAAPAAAKPVSASSGHLRERGEGHDFDVIVIGGGTGGYSAALRAAQIGLKVALIERAKVGGTCLHWGCIPSKALLQTAEVAETAHEAASFGVALDESSIRIDVAAMNAHKDGVVDKMWKGLQGALSQREVEVIAGVARLSADDTVEITLNDGGSRTVSAPSIVVATGSTPRELPFAPFDHKRILSSDDALYLDKLPKSAIVIGSGAVGMEFATAWSAFGVEITVVELADRLLPLEDADSSKEIARAFRKRGVTTHTGVRLTALGANSRSVTATIETSKGEETIKADLVLVAIGRRPVTEGLDLDKYGIEVDDRGFVVVDDHSRTSAKGVWAVGDVIDTIGLAHASFAEGMLVADQLGGLAVTPIDYLGVPRVVYSHPEVASVGYREQQARDAGMEVVIEKYPFQALGRAAMANQTGMVKIIAEKDDSQPGGAGKVLGIHIVGPRATDLIAEAQLITNWEALPIEVAQLVHAHPSFSEAIGEAHMALAGRALHG